MHKTVWYYYFFKVDFCIIFHYYKKQIYVNQEKIKNFVEKK